MSSNATRPVIAEGTYVVDAEHSTVEFSVKHMVVATFRGRFDRYDARVVSDGENVRIDGSVDVESVVVKNDDLRAHLMAPDFFDAADHPQLRFSSERFARSGDRIEVDGRLEIRGRSLPVTATGTVVDPTEDAFGATRLGLELEAVIDRTAYGLDWNMPLPKGGFALANDVTLTASLTLVREA